NAYKGQDAIIPVFHGNPQPLIKVYWNKIKDLMEERIHLKTRAMRDLLRDMMYIIYQNKRCKRLIRTEGLS
ncbi:MAG: hypothetical protein H6Q94_1212, partial [Nitrospirae bacterium]|nr:hypothetical protein [Nitrospirota bacterium]